MYKIAKNLELRAIVFWVTEEDTLEYVGLRIFESMKPEEQPDAGASYGAQENPESVGFIKDVGRGVAKELLREAGTTIKWAVGGAVLGAIIVGGLGLWKFGATGMGVGALAGAVIGGAVGGWIYFSA